MEEIVCPCDHFRSLNDILSALNSEENTRVLTSWLKAGLKSRSGEGSSRLRCQKSDCPNNRCAQLVPVSFIILNGIRDACRPYLEGPALEGSMSSGSAEVSQSSPSYEESFPSLSNATPMDVSTTLVVRKKPKQKLVQPNNVNAPQKQKAKRRIRPVSATVSTESSSIWGSGKLSSSSPGLQGNISVLPSEDPLPMGPPSARPAMSPSWPKPATQEAPKSRPERTRVNLAKAPSIEKKQANVPTKLLNRLAQVYSAIVLSRLVPSTATELHLLVRLLSVGEELTSGAHIQNNSHIFQALFCNAASCRVFSTAALVGVKSVIRNLDLRILTPLVECVLIRKHLPDLTAELSKVAILRREEFLGSDPDSLASITGISQQMAQLTLPFEEDRDSRHNYKSREDMMIYKNREESRDAFLYQLRAFQNMRGTVLDAVQADLAMEKIRLASNDVSRGVMAANVPWFSEFFCELLLQIGLIPMGETDKELLKIADKEKLQKLHKRFSSRGGQVHRSSKNLTLDPKRGTESVSADSEAQQFFPDHQLFFFIFLRAADSYNLACHLKKYLRYKLSIITSSPPQLGLEKRVAQLSLLSKFLGVLVFSPNWNVRVVDSAIGSAWGDDPDTDLPLFHYVEGAWKRRDLTTTIPWVVEFLQMTKWDASFFKSTYCQKLLGLLASIQYDNGSTLDSLCVSEGVNMQRLSFHLEFLFGEIVSLDKIATLPIAELPQRNQFSDQCPDSMPLDSERSALLGANPHVEDFLALLRSFSREQGKTSGTPRKLRPLSISRLARDESTTSELSASVDAPWGNIGARECVVKLSDVFFHQHRDLKAICEYVVSRAIKNATTDVRRSVIQLLESGVSVGSGSLISEDCWHQTEKAAIQLSKEYIDEALQSVISKSLELLFPTGTNGQVKSTACDLSVAHATQVAENVSMSLVMVESKKIRLDYEKKRKKLSASSKVQGLNEEKRSEEPRSSDDGIDILSRVCEVLSSKEWESRSSEVLRHFRRLQDSSLFGSIFTHEAINVARRLLEDIDRSSSALMHWCTEQSKVDSTHRWLLAAETLQVAISARKTGAFRFSFLQLVAHLRKKSSIILLLDLGLHAIDADSRVKRIDGLVTQMSDMTKSRLVADYTLEEALLECANTVDGGRDLAVSFLERYGEQETEQKGKWKDGSAMQMSRLRHALRFDT